MRILDATAGPKGIWYQKKHPFVTFMDMREGVFHSKLTPNTKLKNTRWYNIKPDIVSKWTEAPFSDNYFDMIIFDPPHLLHNPKSTPSAMMIEYGYLHYKNWRKDLKKGIAKLFKILKEEGFFIFKWCDSSISIEEALKLFPYRPLFGTNIKKKTSNTYWIVFIKHRFDNSLKDF